MLDTDAKPGPHLSPIHPGVPAVRFSRLVLLLAATLSLATLAAPAQTQPHWVATWGTAPVAHPNDHHAFTMPITLRQIVHISLGGSTLRLVLTNEQGVSSLIIDEAAAALPAAPDPAAPNAGAIQPNSSVPLTFNGHPSIAIPPGTIAVSDPIPFNLAPLSDLAISLSIAGQAIPTLTGHDLSLETNFVASMNQVSATTLKDAASMDHWAFIKGVEVEAPQSLSPSAPPSATVVAFGDSITEGWHATSGSHNTWPDLLAARLHANPATRNLAVINEGIGGNRVLHDGWGPNALARFDSDVLAPSGVKYLVLLESINDIGNAYSPTKPYDLVSANDVITGLSQLITRAHAHNIKVIGATLTPYMGCGYSSPAGDAVRNAVNQWIRTTTLLDGVIDFDKATRDPANPSVFSPTADSGDHLHPGDAGFHLMADSIDLTLFTK
jgi:lysophospholipase L1-like esterase